MDFGSDDEIDDDFDELLEQDCDKHELPVLPMGNAELLAAVEAFNSGECDIILPELKSPNKQRSSSPVAGPSEQTESSSPVAGPSEQTESSSPVAGPSERPKSSSPVAGPSSERETSVDLDSTASSTHSFDVADANTIEKFYGLESVACCKQECNKNITEQVAVTRRQQFQELSKKEQDLVVLSALHFFRRARGLEKAYVAGKSRKSKASAESDPKELKQLNIEFWIASIRVCRKFFFFVHDIGLARFKNIIAHYEKHGLSTRVHKSKFSTVKNRENVLGWDDIGAVIAFIRRYAEQFALPLPGRMPNCKDFKVVSLSSSDTKAKLYRKYTEARNLASGRVVCRSSFYKIWSQFLPFITVMKPASDLCNVCRLNVSRILQSANTVDEEKAAALQEANIHLENAKTQREEYNAWREKARTSTETEYEGVKGTFAVFSFDYAEQVSYPSNPQQVGPEYFKTPRKCGIFGIHNERTGEQFNFLIDEDDSTGKGADAVISMLDHFLATVDADILVLFADNCVGQNKNNAVLRYLHWRVASGRNKLILYNFLLTGHTKFSPDRMFGVLKSKYAVTVVDCLEDLVSCVTDSSPQGLNKPIPTIDPRTGERIVMWSMWTSFLDSYYRSFPGITKYHHFLFSPNGTLQTKLYANSNFEVHEIQKQSLDTLEALMIEDKLPEGMSAARQWYLYEEVRQFVSDESKKDLVCPKPTVPRKTFPKKVYVESLAEESDPDDPSEIPVSKKTRQKKRKSDADDSLPKVTRRSKKAKLT